MARFSDLPNELLAEVWKYLLAPEDLESFARVCKGVNGQGFSFLCRHRQLRDEYSMFSNEATTEAGNSIRYPTGGNSVRYPLGVAAVRSSNSLIKILTSPRAGLYVRELRLRTWFTIWDHVFYSAPRSEELSPYYPYSTKLNIYKNALTDSILQTELQAWILALENGDYNIVLGLLLLVAPNIVKIDLIENELQRFQRVMEDLATATKPGIPATLRKLRSISLRCRKVETFFQFMVFAASVTSLESISAIGVGLICHPYDPSCLPPPISHIKFLSFERCSFRPADLKVLLSGFKSLESFAYIHPLIEDSSLRPDYNNFRPTAMCKTLSAHTKKSLISLCFRTKDTPFLCMRGLRVFENLKSLEISLCLIANGNNPALVSDLPSSIETMTLRDIDLEDLPWLRRVISRIIKMKSERLPKLGALALHIEEGVNADSLHTFNAMRDKCELTGFTLHILDEDGVNWHSAPYY